MKAPYTVEHCRPERAPTGTENRAHVHTADRAVLGLDVAECDARGGEDSAAADTARHGQCLPDSRVNYFFDFELKDLRGIPLYVPVYALAADEADAAHMKTRMEAALAAASYVIQQAAGPWNLSVADTAFIDVRRAAYEKDRPQRELPCNVLVPPKSQRSVKLPLHATLLDVTRVVPELLAITVDLLE